MPFLTDRLQDTQRKAQLDRALRDENRPFLLVPPARAEAVALKSRFRFDLGAVEAELRAAIVGQDPAIESLMALLGVVRADIGDPRKPLATTLLAGPTGVGKTETVRTLARALYGDADAVCRIDMNTLAQEHYAASLTGAPPGYVGSKEGTTIFDQAKIEGTRELPGIVLFDEIEKASNEVILALLNVFDNGILTVASGERTFSFRNALIFMTTNLGARELLGLRSGRGFWRSLGGRRRAARAKAGEIVLDTLLERFPPEFVNRIDSIEVFDWIGRDTMPRLIAVETERLNRRLHKHNCELLIDGRVADFLARVGHDERFGARQLRRAFRKHVEFPLASFLLTEARLSPDQADRLHFKARLEDDQVRFDQSTSAVMQ